jgi:uncharacterized protein (DUF2384 family)
MGGLIFFSVLAALISGCGLWLATRPTARSHKTSGISVSAVTLLSVISAVERVLGGKARAAEWLDTPNSDLDGRLPLDELLTTAGVERVHELLKRTPDGVGSNLLELQ